ncbi:MAG: SPOR domain-containing protein [Nonlabens sp.]
MKLAEYISDLLYRHECVIIPDFGALITRRVPAQHFERTHTIYPPKKGLGFNATLNQSDGLLENYISKAQSIPFEDTRVIVKREVQVMHTELAEKGSITLYKIGRFTYSESQSIAFTPMYVMNYLPEAYGLSSQELAAVDRKSASPADQETTSESAPKVVPLPVTETVEEISKSSSSSWVKYAATGAMLLGMGYLGFLGYENRMEQESLAIEQQADDHLRTKIQEANIFISDPLPSIELTATPQIKNFHIIAGAFREPANAAKRVRQLQARGFKAKVIGVNSYGLHNVAFESFATRKDAAATLASLKSQGYATAWMFVGELPEG